MGLVPYVQSVLPSSRISVWLYVFIYIFCRENDPVAYPLLIVFRNIGTHEISQALSIMNVSIMQFTDLEMNSFCLGIWSWNLISSRFTSSQPFDSPEPLLLASEMATHSSILAWRILWTEGSGGPQSMGTQRVDRAALTHSLQERGTWLWLGSLFIGT